MAGIHDRLIADAAKKLLQPLGLRRKGRSRLWLGDNGWWLTIVEFQPSGFRKGSYLNVAAHWLWSGSGYISFDLGAGPDGESRVADFEEYDSDGQFGQAAHRLATAAAQAARELVRRLPSIQATADLLLAREAGLPARASGGWSTYHAGVAAGLAGRGGEAGAMLRSITDDRVRGDAEQFIPLLSDRAGFKAAAALRIASQRQALRLPEAEPAPFQVCLKQPVGDRPPY